MGASGVIDTRPRFSVGAVGKSSRHRDPVEVSGIFFLYISFVIH